jgi:hypothetical protein
MLPGTDQLAAVLLAVRNDLEVLANATLGQTDRPIGWNGGYDVTNPQMALLARLDLDNLAANVLPNLPAGWFGVQSTSGYGIARDIRHDLELLADVTVGVSIRPPNWVGDDPIMRCSRATQTLVMLLRTRNLFTPTVTAASPTYCNDLEVEVSVFTERFLLDPARNPSLREFNNDPAATQAPAERTVQVTSANAVGYYDRGATQRAGIIPSGSLIEPIARSYADFSRMTLVRGDGFLLFIDFQDTTLERARFDALDNVNVIAENLYCLVEWCGAAN